MQRDEVLDIFPVGYFSKDEDETGTLIFEQPFHDPNCLRGIETFSHLWLIWSSDEKTLEVTTVELCSVKKREGYGYVLELSSAPIVDGAAIYDIKPYLPFVDAHISLE